jgi:hypothetical protein
VSNFDYEAIVRASNEWTIFMLLASAIFSVIATQPSLSFVARFYKPGASKSQFELYVSDLTGKNQRLLKTPEEPVAVQWIGHDRLAWFSEKGLWTSKLSPWKPTLVKKTTTLHFESSRNRMTEPGMPEFVEDFDRSKGVFILNPASIKLEPAMETPHHEEIEIPGEEETTIPDPSNPEHPIKGKRFDGFSYWSNGKEIKSEWDMFRAWTSDGGAKLWLGIGSHSSTSGDINGVMLFEKGKKPKTIFEDGNCVDFWSGRSLFAYCTPRDTSALGKKQVYTSQLHVGDWKKGNNVTILKGLVWVPSVSIRP